jgi:hypothetical protein
VVTVKHLTAVNDWIAVHATRVFGTMWVFYGLVVYGLLPVLFPNAMNTLLYWSNVIQLVALPLLMVGTNLLGAASEQRAIQTHNAVMEELEIARQDRTELAALVESLTQAKQ